MANRTSPRPICHACNRPFNPSSEGATLTMGPTCAKRVSHIGWDDKTSQLNFLEDLGAQAKPLPPPVKSRVPKRTLPPELREAYLAAKTALDELFRENCGNGNLLHDSAALALETEIYFGGCELHALADPVLGWLEPEHQLQLYIDREQKFAYHRREINGVITLLKIDLENSPSAGGHIQKIAAFTAAVRRHHEGPQLSLGF